MVIVRDVEDGIVTLENEDVAYEVIKLVVIVGEVDPISCSKDVVSRPLMSSLDVSAGWVSDWV